MKRLLILSLLLIATSAMAKNDGLRTEVFEVDSKILGCKKYCTVHLPKDYDSTNLTYPVVYMLHGAGGSHRAYGNIMRTIEDLVAEGTAVQMIVVVPDAGAPDKKFSSRRMGYFNQPRLNWNYQDYFFEELMPAVEQKYRIRAEKKFRAICGISMGGGGTMAYAQYHPELFGTACSLSGGLDGHPHARSFDKDFQVSIFANSAVKILRNATAEQIEKWRTVRWWGCCGDDDNLYESNIQFYKLMRKHNIPYEYRMGNGAHNFEYWRRIFPEVFTFCSMGFIQK